MTGEAQWVSVQGRRSRRPRVRKAASPAGVESARVESPANARGAGRGREPRAPWRGAPGWRGLWRRSAQAACGGTRKGFALQPFHTNANTIDGLRYVQHRSATQMGCACKHTPSATQGTTCSPAAAPEQADREELVVGGRAARGCGRDAREHLLQLAARRVGRQAVGAGERLGGRLQARGIGLRVGGGPRGGGISGSQARQLGSQSRALV